MNLLDHFPCVRHKKEEREKQTASKDTKWAAMKTRERSMEKLHVLAKSEMELRNSFRLASEEQTLIYEKIQSLLLEAMEEEVKTINECLKIELGYGQDLQD